MAPKLDAATSDWQLECGLLRERACRILKMEQWTDCSFLVGGELEQAELKAHKLLLAMASPVFEAMFYGPVAEREGAIAIPDMQPNAFKALLEYIYTDNVVINSNTLACDLYYGAQKYMLPHLQTLCITHLSNNLTTDMVCPIYEFALMVEEKKLIEHCENMIKSQTIDVLNGSSFLEAQLDTVVRMFSLPSLSLDTELVLIRAASKYYEHRKRKDSAKIFRDVVESKTFNFKFTAANEKKNTQIVAEEECNSPASALEAFEVFTPPPKVSQTNATTKAKEEKTDSENEKSSGREILKVLRQINFLSLSSQQLAEENCLASLLNTNELLAIMMNVASTKSYMPMPHGFSANRMSRRRFLNCGGIHSKQMGGDEQRATYTMRDIRRCRDLQQ